MRLKAILSHARQPYATHHATARQGLSHVVPRECDRATEQADEVAGPDLARLAAIVEFDSLCARLGLRRNLGASSDALMAELQNLRASGAGSTNGGDTMAGRHLKITPNLAPIPPARNCTARHTEKAPNAMPKGLVERASTRERINPALMGKTLCRRMLVQTSGSLNGRCISAPRTKAAARITQSAPAHQTINNFSRSLDATAPTTRGVAAKLRNSGLSKKTVSKLSKYDMEAFHGRFFCNLAAARVRIASC